MTDLKVCSTCNGVEDYCSCFYDSDFDVQLKIKLLHEDSKVPVKAHEDDACFDLFAYIEGYPEKYYHLKPGERQLIPLGFSMSVPDGWEAQMRPRSGLALKKGISLVNSPGTIDSGFRSEVNALLINHGKEPVEIHHGDKIAQMKISKVPRVNVVVVD